MSPRRVTRDAQARANRIASALRGLLEDEPPVPEAPRWQGDPFRGLPAEPVAPEVDPDLPCPACASAMIPVYKRGVTIDCCVRCSGLWLDPGELADMIGPVSDEGDVNPATVAGRMAQLDLPPRTVEHRTCPRCDNPMIRRNFADFSGVIADVCPQHGAFLDPGEYEAVEAFIEVGGLKLQRRKLAERNRQAAPRDGEPDRHWWEVFF
ncbi:MAG: zf-TFIIB domain-containing protein [Nannocystaceae bacterium]|nr:zf-TFIIB domain-containing protein [Nannocystaceae bacterium]